MPKKGYRPKASRTKLPLSVEQQRALLKACAEGKERAIFLALLSTGMHPKVLAMDKYNLMWDGEYYAWKRPKTNRPLQGAWSHAMKEGETLDDLKKARGCSRQWYHRVISQIGRKAKIPGVCPNQLRHSNFVNRARLGHNAFDIAKGAATDLDTVYNYYMIGANEQKRLSEEDRTFLEWLVEP